MRKIYFHLLLLLASPCAIGQISLSGTLHQYEGSRIAIGKAASCEMLGEMDTIRLLGQDFKAKFLGSAYTPIIEQARALNASKFAALSGAPPPSTIQGRYYQGWVPQLIDDYGQVNKLMAR